MFLEWAFLGRADIGGSHVPRGRVFPVNPRGIQTGRQSTQQTTDGRQNAGRHVLCQRQRARALYIDILHNTKKRIYLLLRKIMVYCINTPAKPGKTAFLCVLRHCAILQ